MFWIKKRNLVYCLFLALVFLPTLAAQVCAVQELHGKQNSTDDSISFRDEIRPILSNHCFQCHGPDEETREAGLRLDLPNSDIDVDEILMRINSDESYEIMPPPSANKELSEEKIEKLESWIDQGAKYENHWAFLAPIKPEVPGGIHPVDFFVNQRLKQESVKLSERAESAILIRRVYLDLIGLPPTIEQADEFIDHPTQEVYERIVDRLIASPEYGERWARRWLDLARYADTNGYEKDRDRSIWPYRDWVIRAINDGMPFDRFSVEQLAGDMLQDPTIDQRIATGFHRNTMLNEEGGIDPLEYRYYAMVDRVATTGTTWLGLTLGCAQCHTHKFDPITHREYFGMMAYLDNTDEPDLLIPRENQGEARAAIQSEAARLLKELKNHWPTQSEKYEGPTIEDAYQAWLSPELENDVEWETTNPSALSSNSPYLKMEEGGVIFAGGDTTKHDIYTIEFTANSRVCSIRLEALPDSRHPASGPGMTYYEGRKGDFFLSEFLVRTDGENPCAIKSTSETYAKNQFGNHPVSAKLATDGDLQTGWSVYGRPGQAHSAVFNLTEAIEKGTRVTLELHFGRHFASSLGKFRINTTDSTNEVRATNVDHKLLSSLSKAEGEQYLFEQFLLQAPQVAQPANKIHQLRSRQHGTSTLVMRERPAEHPRETFLRHRGEYTSPRDKVNRHLPQSLIQAVDFEMPTNRLEFARWLVDRDNPLTARVVANRQWAAFFGTGLVKTLDDFGYQGEPPSHPQLLDYLAVELLDQDWSIKKLHRLIVTSQTYQRSSTFTTNGEGSDFRLLSRFPRSRLEAEIIRDTSLMAAGLLNKKMYGPPVRPVQPEGAAVNFSQSTWKPSEGADRYRRSIYTYQKRTAPFAMSTTFDAPSGESCVARRDVSNTPLQALTLMNDPMFVEIAEAFGKRMAAAPGEVSHKVELGFRWLLTRKPNPKELAALLQFHKKHEDWTALARAMLCLDEAITKN